ncbi:MAG: hypothetical protein JO113_08255 [Candidatus Eremiobacteraeota bacterium]|nr:hypothetical protein [Candidatus Eremiobacteraeota bacterium]
MMTIWIARCAGVCAVVLVVGCSGITPPIETSLAGNAASSHAKANAVQILYSFSGANDGGDPAADLVFDASGNLWGTTVIGGAASCGTVFSLTPRSSPPWPESVRYNFMCYSDGKNPYGGVLLSSHGDAYGTTVSGGSGPSCGSTGCGVAYELQGSSETVLHDFTGGSDGFGPGGGLAADRRGDLFGTTPDGGKHSYGVVYELFKHRGTWRERVIHAFTGGTDGAVGSLGRLLVDGTGAIYGVTEGGGAHNAGTVFKLTLRSKGGWRLTTVYAFAGAPDCADPYGGLSEDANGNLFGTTYYGGSGNVGCVFKLSAKNSAERVLYSFKGGADGSSPTSTLVLVRRVLYGTTSAGGGSCDCGTIFTVDVPSGKELVLHNFAGGTDGAYPYYGLTSDQAGNLYGTTAQGGSSNQGTVFQLTHG